MSPILFLSCSYSTGIDNPKDVRARDVTRFETVVTADSTDRGKCSIRTSNRDVSFRKFIL